MPYTETAQNKKAPVQYTVWRVDPHGDGFQVLGAGTSSVLESALEKAKNLNRLLKQSEPESADRYVVRDTGGCEMRPGG